MKRAGFAALAVASALVTAPAMAGHGEGLTKSGTIAIAGPQTRTIGGIAEIVGSPCGSVDPAVPTGTGDGVDGVWIALPLDLETGLSPLGGHAATLTANAPNDVDAWFYDEACGLINPSEDPNAYSMAGTDPAPDGDEAGKIPIAAAYVAVDLYVGANASFTFTVSGA